MGVVCSFIYLFEAEFFQNSIKFSSGSTVVYLFLPPFPACTQASVSFLPFFVVYRSVHSLLGYLVPYCLYLLARSESVLSMALIVYVFVSIYLSVYLSRSLSMYLHGCVY